MYANDTFPSFSFLAQPIVFTMLTSLPTAGAYPIAK